MNSHPSPLVVGCGASAVGIGALKDFFTRVTPDSGTAYVVILHPSPNHDSRLAEVLQLSAPIPVTQVTKAAAIEPNHVYVIPPNKSLHIVDGILTLSGIARNEQQRAPVDLCFRALADSQGSRSVCVVLSGTGPSGSSGLKRIKECGGLVIAQDPGEADYKDMPQNAIATGLVDLVLPAAEIPAAIAAFCERISIDDGDRAPGSASDDPEALRDVLSLLLVHTGHDFSSYKNATLRRRIERRMNLRGIASLLAYSRMIRQEPEEAVSLMKELLISVTSFFRDPGAWSLIEQRVIPRLFENKGAQDQVRVWVPGCASGEEAYSVAMLLAEHASTSVDQPAIQVFATDLDQSAIAKAREGLYTEAEVADVSEERLHRFFQRETSGYRVRRDLRELMLFAHHNVLTDPPFSHLDLISCRNLLIYLNRATQERVVETFHFALCPRGYLFLGNAESPNGTNNLFLRSGNTAHVYESQPATSRMVVSMSDSPVLMPPAVVRSRDSRPADRIAPADLHQRLLEQFAPPSVVITEEHNIVHMSERVGQYMQIHGGEPSRDLLQLVMPEIRPDLRTALHQAVKERTTVGIAGIAVPFEDGIHRVNITVKPVLRDTDPARGFLVVLFDEQGAEVPEAASAVSLTSPAEPAARHLEEELARVKAQLRTTVEQYEAQAEEAKASNEELQAMNEELRSAAEELETSREELQSVSEELTTVNRAHKIKVEELRVTKNDFHNVVNATDLGTIFLDSHLRVKFSTPGAREVFNLLGTDAGRPLSDITNRLKHDDIVEDVRTVLDRLTSIEREVESVDGHWYLMRLLPYRTSDNHIDGVVITFHDVTERRRAELRVRSSEERLRILIDGVLEYAIFTIGDDGVIDSWNAGAQRMFGYAADEIIGVAFAQLFTPEDRAAGVPARELDQARRTGRASDERYHLRRDGTRFFCSGVTRRLGQGGLGFAKIARDLTTQRQAADALQAAHDDLEARVRLRTSDLEHIIRDHETAKLAITSLLHRLVTAQEDERGRIARDLHDHFGQQLTALRLTLERAQAAMAGSHDPEMASALALTRQIGIDLDSLAWELRPATLDEIGLAAALPRFVTEWSAHVGIPADFKLRGVEPAQLPRDAQVAFYRIAQEALNNVSKHAHASRVDVILASRRGQVVLVVEDDGVGFDPSDAANAARGLGLAGMRERAVLVGATLQVEAAPGKGTSIFLRRPAEIPASGTGDGPGTPGT
jgi:two-component system CheB/CheR fusion protein